MIFPIGGDLFIWCSRSVVSGVKRAPVRARFLRNNFHNLPVPMHNARCSCKRLCVRSASFWEVKQEQGEELIAAAEDNAGAGLQIELGGEPIYAAQEQTSP